MFSASGGWSMRGIGRVVAAILLAGAVAGAAAFAHGLAGGSETGPFGIDALPPAPTSPLVVEAAAAPPPVEAPISPLPAVRLHAAAAQHARVVVPVVAHARPIVIAAIPQPSAHPDTPVPVPAAQQPVAPPPPPPVTAPTPAPVRVIASVAPAAAVRVQRNN